MPTYEYLCPACRHEWEAFQSIKAEPLTNCPACGAAQAQRQVSLGGGFILKGGGWYSDLYASPKPAAAAGAKDGEAGASTGNGKGDATKPKDAASADKSQGGSASGAGNGEPAGSASGAARRRPSERPAQSPTEPPPAGKG